MPFVVFCCLYSRYLCIWIVYSDSRAWLCVDIDCKLQVPNIAQLPVPKSKVQSVCERLFDGAVGVRVLRPVIVVAPRFRLQCSQTGAQALSMFVIEPRTELIIVISVGAVAAALMHSSQVCAGRMWFYVDAVFCCLGGAELCSCAGCGKLECIAIFETTTTTTVTTTGF